MNRDDVHDGQIGNTGDKSTPRCGRGNGKNANLPFRKFNIHKALLHEITTTLKQNNKNAAHGRKSVSGKTQRNRKTDVLVFFSVLLFLKHKIESIHNLKQKHLTEVFTYLEAIGQSHTTIRNKITSVRTFCNWIGKRGMVLAAHHYVKNKESMKTSVVTDDGMSWQGKGVDPMEILSAIRAIKGGKEERVAVWLEQCWVFRLRIQESMMLRPSVDENGQAIFVRDGISGGRVRIVPIKNDVQRAVLEKAKLLADRKSGKTLKKGKSIEANLQHFYYVMRRVGVTRADKGATANGLLV